MTSDLKRQELVAPVMRFVPVRKVEQSIKFYCEVLGFELGASRDEYGVGAVAEVVYGPARLQFTLSNEVELQPEVLFFQANDVAALRDSICSRGVDASQLQKVNWIKMEMLEVRDPDGHILWFGQSYNQPGITIEHPMLREMLPHLPVSDVKGAIAYFTEKLGFKINYAQDDLGVMYRDLATLLLIERTNDYSGIGSCTVYIENAEQLYGELVGKGANVLAPPVSRPWGLRDFTVADPEGNRIIFAQPFE